MRKIIFVSLVLVACASLSLVSVRAHATTVNINIAACTPSPSPGHCTAGTSFSSGGVTFAGWENNEGFAPADLTYKNESNGETGLGVACTYSTGSKCDQYEINTTPQQYISVDIRGISFSELWLGIGSDDTGGNDASTYPETAYVYGSSCADNSCFDATGIASWTGANAPNNTHLFDFTAAQLTGYDFLYVTPFGNDPQAPVANILLTSLSYTVRTNVPEPGALGIFALGTLLLGLFARLDRCKQTRLS